MKTFLVCPSNTGFMPYLTYYEGCIDDSASYIVWDRFNTEQESTNKFIYKDGLVKHQRSLLSYIKYLFFIYKVILINESDRLIIFGAQLTFFLIPYLLITKKKYVIDLRDYHGLIKFIPDKIFRKASFVGVSSPAYSSLFSANVNVVISHNLYDYNAQLNSVALDLSKPINISYMGAIRDFESQKVLIDSFLNNDKFTISFHGDGDVVYKLKEYVLSCGAKNVEFTGRYDKSEEASLYEIASVVNMLRDNQNYNERVALPNRLYSAAVFYRPCLCFEGTLLSDYVHKYSLGICLNRDEAIDQQILRYFEGFCFNDFKNSCDTFIASVKKDKVVFDAEMLGFFAK